ncbi:MAG: hypothetical protein JRG91_12625 [Deltaproteobacteria bacterium]|nr:hypothetical protein [Deltaproteobacteria bacterium]
MTRRLAVLPVLFLLSGCPKQPDIQGPEDDPGPPPTWEIVYLRSITSDVGDCSNLEHMDTEAHVTTKGIQVYAMHYTDSSIDEEVVTASAAGLEKKLVRNVLPDEEPAVSIIKAVEENRYFSYSDHATFQLGPEVPDGCSGESETITILTPGSTGIISLELGPEHPPLEGMALELHELLSGQL